MKKCNILAFTHPQVVPDPYEQKDKQYKHLHKHHFCYMDKNERGEKRDNDTGLETSRWWINNDTIFIVVWTNALKQTLPVWGYKTHTAGTSMRGDRGQDVCAFLRTTKLKNQTVDLGGVGRPWVPGRVLKDSLVSSNVGWYCQENEYLKVRGSGMWAVQESNCCYGGPGCVPPWEVWCTGYLLV